MNKNSICFFTVFLLLTNSLFALPFDMILTGEDILDDIRFLSIESGKSFLSFTPPLAPGEVRNFLNSIDESSLSQPARNAYYRILDRLTPKARLSYNSKLFSAFVNVNLTLEGKTRFNPDIAWEPRYPERVPIFSFPFRLFFSDYVQLYLELDKVASPIDSEYSNIPIDFSSEYIQGRAMGDFPYRSFGAAGGSWWNFQIGRDRLFWGTSHTGSLTFSDNASLFDFARLSFFTPYVKYSFIVNQLPLKLNNDLFNNPPPNDWEKYLTHTTERYFYLHRLDASLFNKVNLGVMEGLMVGNAPIELRLLNPLSVFHSFFTWNDYDIWMPDPQRRHMVGSFFSVEFNWNIIKSLAVYGQFVMNEFTLSGESSDDDRNPPNEFGYLTGIHYTHSFNNWGSLFFLELIYTSPYLYILSTPFGSFIQQDWYYKFIGYPRDTISLTAGAEFFNNDKLSFSGSFSWISSGEHNKDGLLKWDWEQSSKAYNESTPSGIAENKFILSLGAKWKPLSYLVLKANIAGIISLNNNNNQDVNAAGGQASISASFKY